MTWTTPRNWTDGELVSKAFFNTYIRDNLFHLFIGENTNALYSETLDSDFTVNSETTPQDTGLAFPVDISQEWGFVVIGSFDSHVTPDSRWAMSLPGTLGVDSFGYHAIQLYGNEGAADDIGNNLIVTAGVNTSVPFLYYGNVFTSSVSGEAKVQLAQRISDAENTTIHAGTTLIAFRFD